MAELHFPTMLAPLFAGFERKVEVDAPTVGEALDRVDAKWPGLRDRLCESRQELRPHIHVYVDRERATLETPLEGRSRVDVIAAISGG
jgi:molybdopterin converting factor small subunit